MLKEALEYFANGDQGLQVPFVSGHGNYGAQDPSSLPSPGMPTGVLPVIPRLWIP
jgi:hypothetical protein